MHKYLPNLFVFLDQYEHHIFQNNITNLGIIYRNYNQLDRKKELVKIARQCKKKRYKLFVSNSIKLAIYVKADGIYIPSFNKSQNFTNYENKKLIIIGSAHNQKEIHQKIQQNCKAIFLSPIFHVKKNGNYLNIYRFNSLSRTRKISILPLGGVNSENIKKLNLLNSEKGFGGIGIFKKKPAFKRPVFLKNNNSFKFLEC
jgi:thiamine monophosphate synthase